MVIEAGRHECHGLDDAEAVGQAPAHQNVVSGRHKDSWTGEGFCRGDERLQVDIGLGGGVAEEGEVRCVSGDPASAFYYARSALLDCLRQVDTAVESVNPAR